MGIEHLTLHQKLHITASALFKQRQEARGQRGGRYFDIRAFFGRQRTGVVVAFPQVKVELHSESVVVHPLGLKQSVVREAENARSRPWDRLHVWTEDHINFVL